jgi:hypothetical protein
MRSTASWLTSGTALAVLVLSATEARPCGGAFGYEYTLSPSQNIVVGYRDGIETYIFNPGFCGKASEFGLILPVPAVLSQTPALHQKQLYTDLAAIAAPTIQTTEICSGSYQGPGRGGVPAGTGGSASNGGTTVIQRGTVGVFDYALLQAETAESFTDWLDANGFPYEDSAQAVFEHYVDNRWYFVAFKVSAGADPNGTGGNGSGGAAGGSGGTLDRTMCGDFGPISLSFPVEPNPVVPTRIAAVSSSSLTWIVYTLAEHQLRVQDMGTELRFSGAVTQLDLAQRPTVAKVAVEGTRLTELYGQRARPRPGARTGSRRERLPAGGISDCLRPVHRRKRGNCRGDGREWRSRQLSRRDRNRGDTDLDRWPASVDGWSFVRTSRQPEHGCSDRGWHDDNRHGRRHGDRRRTDDSHRRRHEHRRGTDDDRWDDGWRDKRSSRGYRRCRGHCRRRRCGHRRRGLGDRQR